MINHPQLSRLENALCGFDPKFRRPSDAMWDGRRLEMVRTTLRGLPARFKARVEGETLKRLAAGGDSAAGGYLWGVRGTLSSGAVALAASDDEIRSVAKTKAAECRGLWDLAACMRLAVRSGVKVPDVKKKGVAGSLARLWDEAWWRRALRVAVARDVERHAIGLGFVHRRAGKYASDESVKRRGEQKKRNRAMMEAVTAVNECGQSYTLAELADLSVSNPKIRRGELMVRISGFEAIAKAAGHVGEFWTMTCPSKYHARISGSCESNPKYEGRHPREGQAYLSGVWQRVRAQLAKKSIRLYGIRVAEPQHDGTAHWHLLVFVAPSQRDYVRSVVKAQSLKVDGKEPGADRHRFDAVAIDPAKGSAAGYIAKYISKNIDGHGLDSDYDGGKIDGVAARVDAWASTWGIRQFQQLGGAPVGVWRELRRVEPGSVDGLMGEAARAADGADWAGYIELQGGIDAKRKDMPIGILKVWSDVRGKYAEEIGNVVKGLVCGAVEVVTRVHEWVLKLGGDFDSPWSTVNNCNLRVGKNDEANRENGKGAGNGHYKRTAACGKSRERGGYHDFAGENGGFDRNAHLQAG